jgi:4'-phosphopantetheinyl transferase
MFEHADVIVLFCSVPRSDNLIGALSELLSDDERSKAARFVFDDHGRLYVTAHALLRHSLWCATGRTDTPFRVNRFGKPEIVETGGGPPVKFNISHSGALAVCSLSPRFEVGVDVEEVDDSRSFEEVVETQFTSYEQDQLAAYSGAARADAFFRFWTLKEALVKALGVGLEGMSRYGFDLEPPSLAVMADSQEALAVHVEQRLLTSSYWASLAVLRPPDTSVAVEWRCVPAQQIALGFRE